MKKSSSKIVDEGITADHRQLDCEWQDMVKVSEFWYEEQIEPAAIHKMQNRILLKDGKQKLPTLIMDHWPVKRN